MRPEELPDPGGRLHQTTQEDGKCGRVYGSWPRRRCSERARPRHWPKGHMKIVPMGEGGALAGLRLETAICSLSAGLLLRTGLHLQLRPACGAILCASGGAILCASSD